MRRTGAEGRPSMHIVMGSKPSLGVSTKQVGRRYGGGGRAVSEGVGVDPRSAFGCFIC